MVGEENKAGEDETMRCQPVPTRSPAAALMSAEKPLPPAQRRAPCWRGTHRLCAAAGGQERRLQSGGRQSGGTAEDEGLSCPRVGTRARPRVSSHRGAAARCRLCPKPRVLPVHGGAGRAPLHTLQWGSGSVLLSSPSCPSVCAPCHCRGGRGSKARSHCLPRVVPVRQHSGSVSLNQGWNGRDETTGTGSV